MKWLDNWLKSDEEWDAIEAEERAQTDRNAAARQREQERWQRLSSKEQRAQALRDVQESDRRGGRR